MAMAVAVSAPVVWSAGAVGLVRLLHQRAWRMESAQLTVGQRNLRAQRLVLAGVALTGGWGLLGLAICVAVALAADVPPGLRWVQVLACAVAVPAATGAVYFRGRWPELAVDGAAGFVIAIPDFLWGLLFILVLGVLVPVLPISGRIDPTLDFEPATGFYLAEAVVRLRPGVFLDLLKHILEEGAVR